MATMSGGTPRGRGLAVLGALALGLALVGCTTASPAEWTFRDEPLLRADEDLAGFTAAWRAHVAIAQKPATVPDQARCYFRVDAPHAVRNEVVCGPVRYEGEQTSWESARIASFYAHEGRVALGLVDPSERAFRALEGSPPGDLRAADGTQPDRGADLTAPQLPELPPGELAVVTREDPGSLEAVHGADDPGRDDGLRMVSVGEGSVLIAFAATDRSRDPAVHHRAPAGHRLVAVSMGRQLIDAPADDAHPLRITLRPGDHATPIPLDPSALDGEQGLARVVVAVPVGEEAHIDITDGTHRASAGSGAGDARSDFPRPLWGSGSQTLTVSPPAGTDGAVVVASLDPALALRGPGDPDGPWDVSVSMPVSSIGMGDETQSPMAWSAAGSPVAQYETTTPQILSATVTADGTAVPAVIDASDPSSPLITGSAPLPGAPGRIEVRGTLRLVGTDPEQTPGGGYTGTVPAGVPAQATAEVPFAVAITVEPDGPENAAAAW